MATFDEQCEEIDSLADRKARGLVDTLDIFLQFSQACRAVKPKSNTQILLEQMKLNTVQQNKNLKRLMKDRHYKKKGFKEWVLASEKL